MGLDGSGARYGRRAAQTFRAFCCSRRLESRRAFLRSGGLVRSDQASDTRNANIGPRCCPRLLRPVQSPCRALPKESSPCVRPECEPVRHTSLKKYRGCLTRLPFSMALPSVRFRSALAPACHRDKRTFLLANACLLHIYIRFRPGAVFPPPSCARLVLAHNP